MKIENYFPKGIAEGNAFCNRKAERKHLIDNIQSNHHTLIMSPRRYGKTSLVRYTLNENNIIYGDADLFIAVDAERIQQRILAGIKSIIEQTCSSLEHAISLLTDSFKNLSQKWIIGTKGINIELIPQQMDPATAVVEGLQALDNFLIKKKARAVLFIDEVQEIGEVARGRGIEGAIRHVAQASKQLTFIFSGSKRHLLTNMFYDKARPLYKLCDRIMLDRISANDYTRHLNKLAIKCWERDLPTEVLDTIFQKTELHPYYMNLLSLKVWLLAGNKIPNTQNAEDSWHKIIGEEKTETIQELSALSSGQRKILIAIANGHNKELTGKAFLRRVDMTGSTVSESLQVLEQKDYLRKVVETNEYLIIDPMIRSTLFAYFSDY